MSSYTDANPTLKLFCGAQLPRRLDLSSVCCSEYQPRVVYARPRTADDSFFGREARLTYAMIHRDLSASVYPALLLMMSALLIAAPMSIGYTLLTLGKGAIYFFFYIYCFCFANQIVGIEEDRINKPDRPLVSGCLGLTGAWRRWSAGMVLFPLLGLVLGGLEIMLWALVWQGLVISYNFLGLHRHWLTKNVVFISAGTIALLAPAWRFAAPLDGAAWKWILTIAVSFGTTLHLQDLRDIEGDRWMRRKTLPLVAGEEKTRWLLAICVGAILPAIIHALIAPHTAVAALWESVLFMLNLAVAARVVLYRLPSADHRTYLLHTYWFCLVLMSPGIMGLFNRCFG